MKTGVVSKIRSLEVAKAAEDVVTGETALPIDPFKIAQSRDIVVKAMESTGPGISGFLMKSGEAFGIGYSNRIKNPGYINFTVSHELGHYFTPGHVEKLFTAGSGTHSSRSGFITADPCEREADLFAAALLMPAGLFRKALRGAGEGFPAIERLSNQCVTSITATAIRFAEFSENAVAIVLSNNGAVDFCSLSPALQDLQGITWMQRGDAIPVISTTSRFQKDPQNIVNGIRAEGCSMLDEWLDGAPRIEMKEDVVGLGHYGKTLTVLFTDKEVESEDPDAEQDSFDRWQRWEKRR
jgi:Zn-dependent peptidase ImmA (M78 family)